MRIRDEDLEGEPEFAMAPLLDIVAGSSSTKPQLWQLGGLAQPKPCRHATRYEPQAGPRYRMALRKRARQ